MLCGHDPAPPSARKVPSCSTSLWPMVTSPGNLWTMGTWAPCPFVKICAVNHTSVTRHLWRENVVSLFIVTTRFSVCGCRPKTTNICCNFRTLIVSTVFQTAVSRLKSHARHYIQSGYLSSRTKNLWPFSRPHK